MDSAPCLPLKEDVATRRSFLNRAFETITNSYFHSHDENREGKVVNHLKPHEIKKRIDFSIGEQGCGFEGTLDYVKPILENSVQTAHPRFMNMLFAGAEEAGIVGELIAAVQNTSMATFEVAPVFSVMEKELLAHMRKLAGLPVEKGDGVFSPGGSISNLYGMMCARYRAMPSCKSSGIGANSNLVAFTSEAAHYSTKRASYVLGFGTQNCVPVKTDDLGRMIPEELEREIEKAISEGMKPFYVSATAGTTVEAAFDPIDRIADVTEKYGLWLHVDGAYGGSVVVSRKHRHLAKGLERADSMTWNPHKLLGVPLQSSAFLVREQGLLQEVMGMGAKYIFHDHDDEDSLAGCYDTGDKSLQCGRRVDAPKLWLAWKTYGDLGFESRIDRAFELAQYTSNCINESCGKFVLLHDVSSVNVCFRYVPQAVRDVEEGHYKEQYMHETTKASRMLMLEEGVVLVNQVSAFPAYYRLALNSPSVKEEDLDFMLKKIEEYSEAVKGHVESVLAGH